MSSPGAANIPVLVITGPVGVGKTTVASALSELLAEAALSHALIDLDWLRWCYPHAPHDPFHTALGLQNLAAVWSNYRAAGAERLIMTDIVETRATLAAYQAALPGTMIVVVRLHATLPTLRARLAGREVGASLVWHQQRAAELITHMTKNPVEDLWIDTEGRTIMDIAWDIAARTQWLKRPHPQQ